MLEIFKAYDIRGSYPDKLDENIARRIGFAFAEFLKPGRIVVGRDMRLSSDSLCKAFIDGALTRCRHITDIGVVTTPMLYFAVIDGKFDGGAMVTASHLPAGINGFKLCRENAIPLSGDHGLPDIKKQVEQEISVSSKPMPGSNCEKSDMLDRYIDRLAQYIDSPRPLKVVVDAGNGTAGKEVVEIFRKVPSWKLTGMYMNPDGSMPHHVANPLIPSTTRDLQERVMMEKADIGVAFDGDADRCGFIDEKGQRISEDLITALISESLLTKNAGATILYDLRSSRIVSETIYRLGGKPKRCRVGHSFIKEKMRQENALFAGELSGHYYYKDMGFTDNAVFTMIWMLNFLSSKDAPLSTFVDPLRKYYSTGEINMQVQDKQTVFNALEKSYADANLDYLDGLTVQYKSWWFNLRPSNTEPAMRLNMEADNAATLEEKKNELFEIIKQAEPIMEIMH